MQAGNPGYRIRRGRAADVPLLPGIEREAARMFDAFGLSDVFAAVLTSEEDLDCACQEGRLWVATQADDVPVGFAVASRVGDHGHLDELDVHPDHGRRGLGGALVGAVLRWAREQNLPAVTLTTLRHVPWNAPFYERLGFRALADHERGPVLDEILREEVERGLPAVDRVAMRREL
jgi:GNAT superfamily N-acetyltransferase